MNLRVLLIDLQMTQCVCAYTHTYVCTVTYVQCTVCVCNMKCFLCPSTLRSPSLWSHQTAVWTVPLMQRTAMKNRLQCSAFKDQNGSATLTPWTAEICQILNLNHRLSTWQRWMSCHYHRVHRHTISSVWSAVWQTMPNCPFSGTSTPSLLTVPPSPL